MQFWTESQVNSKKYLGNPSLLTIVSQYMINLQWKKVFIKFHHSLHAEAFSHFKAKADKVITSAWTMNEPIMKNLSDYNQGFLE